MRFHRFRRRKPRTRREIRLEALIHRSRVASRILSFGIAKCIEQVYSSSELRIIAEKITDLADELNREESYSTELDKCIKARTPNRRNPQIVRRAATPGWRKKQPTKKKA